MCGGEGWFRCSHAWWHVALCHLEEEEVAVALQVYDNKVVGQLAHTPLVRKGMEGFPPLVTRLMENCVVAVQVRLNALLFLLHLEVRGHGSCVDARLPDVISGDTERGGEDEVLLHLVAAWAAARLSSSPPLPACVVAGPEWRRNGLGAILAAVSKRGKAGKEVEMDKWRVSGGVQMGKALYSFGLQDYKAVAERIPEPLDMSALKVGFRSTKGSSHLPPPLILW